MRLGFLVVSLFALGCGSGPKAVAPVPDPPPAATDQRALAALVETGLLPAVRVEGEERFFSLDERMRAHKVPGVSIAIIENNEIVWAKGYGTTLVDGGRAVTTETLFQAASISKPVNALVTLRVAHAGKLDLDAPVNQYLRGWKLPANELTKKTPVTIRHLLSHTAGTTVHGFPGFPTGATVATLTQVLAGEPPSNTPPVVVDTAPGSRYRYSGGGTSVVEKALVDTLGDSYPAIARRWALDPLGMSSSGFDQPLSAARLERAAAGHDATGLVVPSERHVYPQLAAAGLWTTPTDLARFFIAVGKARAGLESPVEAEVARLMTTPVAPVLGGGHISLGPFLTEARDVSMFEHGGANAGFRCHARVALEGGFGYVIMTNGDNGGALVAEIERTLFSRRGWPGIDEPVTRVALDAEALERVTGRYLIRGVLPFSIVAVDGRPMLKRPFDEPIDLVAIGDGAMIARSDGMRFDVGVEGRQIRVTAPRAAGGRVLAGVAIGADARVPVFLLDEGRFDDAVDAWRELDHSEPGSLAGVEPALNQIGYMLLGRGERDKALEVLRFVTVVRPASSNAWDSLGEAHLIRGETAKAIAAYEKALAKLDADRQIPAEQRPARRRHGEQQLEKLRARPK